MQQQSNADLKYVSKVYKVRTKLDMIYFSVVYLNQIVSSGHLVPKWRRIDVITTSFLRHVPAGIVLFLY